MQICSWRGRFQIRSDAWTSMELWRSKCLESNTEGQASYAARIQTSFDLDVRGYEYGLGSLGFGFRFRPLEHWICLGLRLKCLAIHTPLWFEDEVQMVGFQSAR
ncbi:unnamed protein product [Lathyrus oleraceus]